MKEAAPVITIDGPSGSGKGSLASRLAIKLGWNFLDSGALYRLLALHSLNQKIDANDVVALTQAAEVLPVRFIFDRETGDLVTFLDDKPVGNSIRTEQIAGIASQVAAEQSVRQALLARQRDFLQMPGLVADGRDMGTIIFPDAPLKFYLTASAEIRAKRRHAQLKNQGLDANLAGLLDEINIRDERDWNRPVAPLRPALDAIQIDTSLMALDDVWAKVWEQVEASGLAVHVTEIV